MAEEKKAAKAAILNELESIKGLLNEEGLEDDEMVPTLQEIVALDDDPNSATSESAPTQTHQTEIEESTITNAKPLAPLPGQQSLFGDGDVTEDKTEPHTPSNKQPNKKARKYENKQQNSEENPFLPKHIRDRLQGNKPHLGMQSFVSEPLDSKPDSPKQHPQIIDELVAEFMPKIERELRQRLEQMLDRDELDE
jgi:hypothetical protein